MGYQQVIRGVIVVIEDFSQDFKMISPVSLVILHVGVPHKISQLIGNNYFFWIFMADMKKGDILLV
jgi:hypothetical protein